MNTRKTTVSEAKTLAPSPVEGVTLPIHFKKAMPGRNDLCHCESGKKYKRCCEAKDRNPPGTRMFVRPKQETENSNPKKKITMETTQKIDLKSLSAEEKRELMQQLEAEEAEKKEAEQKLKSDYQSLKNEQVVETFGRLKKVSASLESEKEDIYDQFQTLIDMKMELFGLTDADIEMQQSHTFTSDDGTMSIVLGSNVVDGWTDEVGIGIDGVNKWIDSKITDPKSHGLLKAMLKPNKDGVLQANRVLDMSKEARKIGDKELIDWVVFIQEQWRPEKTSTYVKAKWRDENNKWQWLALSMSAV